MDKSLLMKKCFKCKQEKPLSEFYRHKAMRDGHLGKCKDCTKRDALKHREANLEKVRAYDRERAKLPHRIQSNTNRTRLYRQDNPEKNKAHFLADKAIRNGKLKQEPCLVCGAKERVEKHHNDYSKPLDVIFLCSAHHSAIHFGKLSLVKP